MEFLMENITCDSLNKFPPMHLYYVFPLFLIKKK